MSPSRPPTANATMTEREEGSMLGGHRARRKSDCGVNDLGFSVRETYRATRIDILGGPEIYNVARRALTAGLPGKRTVKILEVKLVVSGMVARLCSLRVSTRGHFCHLLG